MEGNLNCWKEDLSDVISRWDSRSRNVVISPDVDGLLSTVLLSTRYEVKVAGIYTTSKLLLLDEYDSEDCAEALWLDHDVSQPGVSCVGQHLVNHSPGDILPLREPSSFNPNVAVRQSWRESFSGSSGGGRDKYPFGTCHFLAEWLSMLTPIEPSRYHSLLAHADSTWRTAVNYPANAGIWHEDMFSSSEFMREISTWQDRDDCLSAHRFLVADLVEMGVSKKIGQAKPDQGLPDEIKALTGQQSVPWKQKNHQAYADVIFKLLDYISGAVREIGAEVSLAQIDSSSVEAREVIEGTYRRIYPNEVEEFDNFMLGERIFSHAFTGQSELSYTTGIEL